MGLRFRKACDTILESYECSLRVGSRPIAFAESETHLERLSFEALSPHRTSGETLCETPRSAREGCPGAPRLPAANNPARELDYKLVRRLAGVGNLDQEARLQTLRDLPTTQEVAPVAAGSAACEHILESRPGIGRMAEALE